MIHSILGYLATHWKIEAVILSVVGFFSLLLHEVTRPTVLLVLTTLADWDFAVSKQIIISTLSSAVTLFLVWLLQKKIQANRDRRLTAELEEKTRLKEDQVTLRNRVTETEEALRELLKNFALMDQQATPLFEAAKIKLIETLTHPSPEFKIPDALLAAVKEDNIITPELRAMLKKRETSTHPEVTAEEKLAAAILPIIVEIAANEKVAVKTVPSTTQLVSSPVNQKKEERERERERESK